MRASGLRLNLSRVTAQKYVAILERLFLVRTLNPWFSNRLSRLIKTPKLHFLDSGLLAVLRGDTIDEHQRGPQPVRSAARNIRRVGNRQTRDMVGLEDISLALPHQGSGRS